MRFAHFVAAAAFVATAIVRIYWLFAGNKFERFTALFPVKPRDWVNMFRLMKKYMMIHPERGPHYLGHNPMQQLSYTGIYIAAGLEVLTGFILYGVHNPGGFFDGVFGWMTPLMGGLQMVRFIHHALMWAFVIFLPIHVYLGVRSDVMDREGTMSSIFSGGRFVRSDAHFEDE
jgi:Ni/Fe-hydrogenase b-type cytochrome subunit